MLFQPSADLLNSQGMMNLCNYQRPMAPKELRGAQQDLVLAAFDVDLDYLRRGSPARDERIERDRRDFDQLGIPQYGPTPIGLDATLRPRLNSSSKGNPVSFRFGPYGGMTHLDALAQIVSNGVLAHACDVIGISVECDNASGLAHNSRNPKREIAKMSADVIDHMTRLHCRQKRPSHLWLVFATPIARVIW